MKVNKLVTFFPSIYTKQRRSKMKLLNGGGLCLGTSKNVSVSNSSLLYNVATVFNILFAFSAIKGPAKELRLSVMLGEKYVNKIFLLFSRSENAQVSAN